ncbi:uncharacterized protein Tco025E_08867, partial [Trypanosoma conorhini]
WGAAGQRPYTEGKMTGAAGAATDTGNARRSQPAREANSRNARCAAARHLCAALPGPATHRGPTPARRVASPAAERGKTNWGVRCGTVMREHRRQAATERGLSLQRSSVTAAPPTRLPALSSQAAPPPAAPERAGA